MKLLFPTALLTGTLALCGCASIISGSQQSISVTATTPQNVDLVGAACSFENGKGKWFAPTPGSVTVHRAYGPLVVHCDHADWTGDAQAASTTKGMAFGNILLGGVIGAGVDIGTGAAYDYPQLITVPMKARTATASDALAAAATVGAAASTASAAPSAQRPQPARSEAAAVASPVETQAAATLPAASAASPPLPASAPAPVPAATSGRSDTAAEAEPRPARPTGIVVATTAAASQPGSDAAAGAAKASPPRPLAGGQDGFNASRVARESACHTLPTVQMTAKGPGFELYSVACVNGDALAIRCEYGNCRALR